MGKDRPLERLERLAGLEAEVLGQQPTCLAIRIERLGLPPRSIQREHELRAQTLPQRVLSDRCLQLTHDAEMPAKCQLGLETLLERGQPELLEPSGLSLSERLIGELGQRRAAP